MTDPIAARIAADLASGNGAAPAGERVDGADARTRELAHWVEPLDWPAFLAAGADDDQLWLVDQLVPTGRHVALFARGKAGKSLLMLDVAAAVASGRPVLGGPAVEPVDVVYLDLENPASDIRERVFDLGYDVDSPLDRLHYFHLPALPPLDTEQGGAVLAALAARFDARLVVVDTVASGLAGEENSADTYRAFARHTGRRLRPLGAALVRVDHAGKDPAKGQRGSSAKDDDVDVVLELTASGDRILVRRLRSRLPWVPAEVRLTREVEPLLRHVLDPVALPDGTVEVADILDDLGVPLDTTTRAAGAALQAAGMGRRTAVVLAAQRYRRRPR